MSDVRLIFNDVTQKYEATFPSIGVANPLVTESGVQTLTNKTLTNPVIAGGGTFLASDGTVGAPSYAFASETTLGFYRLLATRMGLAGGLTVSTSLLATTGMVVGATAYYNFQTRGYAQASATGLWNFQNEALTAGVSLKFDAAPTVASGFGTSPSITAGSTPMAGSINVGTGGAATSGIINFNGTAFPSAPFAVVTTSLTNAVTRAVASTTQLTLTSTTAWTASDVISWICIGSK